MQLPEDGKSWLFAKIDDYNNNKDNNLRLPRKTNGELYKLEDLNEEQFKIAYVILKKIKEWLSLYNATEDRKKKFKPLRMTVMGCGGTGKSVLINTLVCCIRKVFDDNNSVFVTAPTGAAAYNVGGTTIHKEFKLNYMDTNSDGNLGDNAKQTLIKKLLQTIVILFDERSMIGQITLGDAESNIRKTAHNGGHENEDWGGIPVVVAFGDDYQLPAPALGAIESLVNQGKCKSSQNGAQQFINLGKTTMELTKIMRQSEKEKPFLDLLFNMRFGHPREQDKDTLLSLHLNSDNFTPEQIEEIKRKATYVCANKKEVIEHNWNRLREEHSNTNPVARIQTQTINNGTRYRGTAKCLRKESDIEPILNICRGARVQIRGKNFEPDWGLYNGAIGHVVEIIYEKNSSPLDGSIPEYVVVDFPQYRGPPWIQEKPSWIPIPPLEVKCRKHCCTLQYLPLSLAYAKTGHTFQGQTVGPGYVIPCIVVHPGKKKMELNCPGLMYMFISRATTIGTPENRNDSAIFFCSNDMNRDRISNMTKTQKGEEGIKIKHRRKWISFLRRNLHHITVSQSERKKLIDWVETTKISSDVVMEIIDDMNWRKSNQLNY